MDTDEKVEGRPENCECAAGLREVYGQLDTYTAILMCFIEEEKKCILMAEHVATTVFNGIE